MATSTIKNSNELGGMKVLTVAISGNTSCTFKFGASVRGVIFTTGTTAYGRTLLSIATGGTGTASFSQLAAAAGAPATTVTTSGGNLTIATTANIVATVLLFQGALPTVSNPDE